MSAKIKQQLPFLDLLVTANKKQATALIRAISPKQMKSLIEIIINIQYGNISISDQNKAHMNRRRNIIRQLTIKRITRDKRKQLIEKHCSLIVFLLKATLSEIKKLIHGT